MPSSGPSHLRQAAGFALASLVACTAAVRPGVPAPKHTDGAHYHAFAAALREGEARAPASMGRVSNVYIVKKGDTLYSLARAHSMTVKELAALNGINKPEELQAGARLRLPARKHAGLEANAGGPVAAPASAAAAATTATASAAVAPPPATTPGTLSYMLRWPVRGTLTSRFGARSGHPHDGIDIGAPSGTDVLAAADGEVVFADSHGGYGNVVILRHRNGLLTIYAHHERNLVRKGQEVHAGDPIARVGTTGKATGPHLHFEVRQGTRPQNPLRFLPPAHG